MDTWRGPKYRLISRHIAIVVAICLFLTNSNITLAKPTNTVIDKPNGKRSLFEEPDASGGPSHVWPFRHTSQRAPFSFGCSLAPEPGRAEVFQEVHDRMFRLHRNEELHEERDDNLEAIYTDAREDNSAHIIRPAPRDIVEEVIRIFEKEIGADIAREIAAYLRELAAKRHGEDGIFLSGINLIDDERFTVPHSGMAINIPIRGIPQGMLSEYIKRMLIHEAIAGTIVSRNPTLVHELAEGVEGTVDAGNYVRAAELLSVVQPQGTGDLVSEITQADVLILASTSLWGMSKTERGSIARYRDLASEGESGSSINIRTFGTNGLFAYLRRLGSIADERRLPGFLREEMAYRRDLIRRLISAYMDDNPQLLSPETEVPPDGWFGQNERLSQEHSTVDYTPYNLERVLEYIRRGPVPVPPPDLIAGAGRRRTDYGREDYETAAQFLCEFRSGGRAGREMRLLRDITRIARLGQEGQEPTDAEEVLDLTSGLIIDFPILAGWMRRDCLVGVLGAARRLIANRESGISVAMHQSLDRVDGRLHERVRGLFERELEERHVALFLDQDAEEDPSTAIIATLRLQLEGIIHTLQHLPDSGERERMLQDAADRFIRVRASVDTLRMWVPGIGRVMGLLGRARGLLDRHGADVGEVADAIIAAPIGERPGRPLLSEADIDAQVRLLVMLACSVSGNPLQGLVLIADQREDADPLAEYFGGEYTHFNSPDECLEVLAGAGFLNMDGVRRLLLGYVGILEAAQDVGISFEDWRDRHFSTTNAQEAEGFYAIASVLPRDVIMMYFDRAAEGLLAWFGREEGINGLLAAARAQLPQSLPPRRETRQEMDDQLRLAIVLTLLRGTLHLQAIRLIADPDPNAAQNYFADRHTPYRSVEDIILAWHRENTREPVEARRQHGIFDEAGMREALGIFREIIEECHTMDFEDWWAEHNTFTEQQAREFYETARRLDAATLNRYFVTALRQLLSWYNEPQDLARLEGEDEFDRDLHHASSSDETGGETFSFPAIWVLSQLGTYRKQKPEGMVLHDVTVRLVNAVRRIEEGAGEQEIIEILRQPASQAGLVQVKDYALREGGEADIHFDIGRLAFLIEQAAESVCDTATYIAQRDARHNRIRFTTLYVTVIRDLRMLAMGSGEAQLQQIGGFSFSDQEQETIRLFDFIDQARLAEDAVTLPGWATEAMFTPGEIRALLGQFMGDLVVLSVPDSEIPRLLTHERALAMLRFIQHMPVGDLRKFLERCYCDANLNIAPPQPTDPIMALRMNSHVARRRQYYYDVTNGLCRKIAALGLTGKVEEPLAVAERLIRSVSRTAIVSHPDEARVILHVSFDFSEGDKRILKLGNVGFEFREGEGSIGVLLYDETSTAHPAGEVTDAGLCGRLYKPLKDIAKRFPSGMVVMLSGKDIKYYYKRIGGSQQSTHTYLPETQTLFTQHAVAGVLMMKPPTRPHDPVFDEVLDNFLNTVRLAIMALRKGLVDQSLAPELACPTQDNTMLLAQLNAPGLFFEKPVDRDEHHPRAAGPRIRTFAKMKLAKVMEVLELHKVDTTDLREIISRFGIDPNTITTEEFFKHPRIRKRGVIQTVHDIIDDPFPARAFKGKDEPKRGFVTDITQKNRRDRCVRVVVDRIKGLVEKLRGDGLHTAADALEEMLKRGEFKMLRARRILKEVEVDGRQQRVYPFIAHPGKLGIWCWDFEGDVAAVEREYTEAVILEEAFARMGTPGRITDKIGAQTGEGWKAVVLASASGIERRAQAYIEDTVDLDNVTGADFRDRHHAASTGGEGDVYEFPVTGNDGIITYLWVFGEAIETSLVEERARPTNRRWRSIVLRILDAYAHNDHNRLLPAEELTVEEEERIVGDLGEAYPAGTQMRIDVAQLEVLFSGAHVQRNIYYRNAMDMFRRFSGLGDEGRRDAIVNLENRISMAEAGQGQEGRQAQDVQRTVADIVESLQEAIHNLQRPDEATITYNQGLIEGARGLMRRVEQVDPDLGGNRDRIMRLFARAGELLAVCRAAQQRAQRAEEDRQELDAMFGEPYFPSSAERQQMDLIDQVKVVVVAAHFIGAHNTESEANNALRELLRNQDPRALQRYFEDDRCPFDSLWGCYGRYREVLGEREAAAEFFDRLLEGFQIFPNRFGLELPLRQRYFHGTESALARLMARYDRREGFGFEEEELRLALGEEPDERDRHHAASASEGDDTFGPGADGRIVQDAPTPIRSREEGIARVRDIDEAYLRCNERLASNIESGRRIIIPDVLIPVLAGEKENYQEVLRRIAGRTSDIKIVSVDKAAEWAKDAAIGRSSVILLTPELARRMGLDEKTCIAQSIMLGTPEHPNYDFAYLEGAIGLARAVLAGDPAALRNFYWLLTGGRNLDDDYSVDDIMYRRMGLTVILPAIEIPHDYEDYLQIQREAYRLLKAA